MKGMQDTLSMKCGLPYCNAPGKTDNPTMQAMMEAMQPMAVWSRREKILEDSVWNFWLCLL